MASLVVLVLVLVLMAQKGVDGTIGVNWGRENAQRLIPSQVVDLLLQNGVREARVFSSREDMLRAFAGSGIGLTMSLNDVHVLRDYEGCMKWVQLRMPYFNTSSVRRIYIGNHPFLTGLKDRVTLRQDLDTLYNMQKALNDAEWGHQIKTTFMHSNAELKPNITKPSEAEFRDEIKPEMAEFLRFLEANQAPFVINLIPSFLVMEYKLHPLFAFVGESPQVIKDVNGAVYTHVFEFIHDAFVWALIKLKAPDVKIVVGQVGWPTDGYTLGNASTAERFFKGLLPYVSSNKGTPLRPGAPIDTYVHTLTDENKLPNFFMRHWGIYRSNGKPKFKIDLTGQGRDMYPPSAKGIFRMPERWCVFNGNRTDYPKVLQQLEYACKNTDCSSLKPGGSCDKIGLNKHVSYAFNMFFQFRFQDEEACRFDGLSYISVKNPSTPKCIFPIEVVQGEQENYLAAAYRTPSMSKVYHHTPNCVVSLFLLLLLGAFFSN